MRYSLSFLFLFFLNDETLGQDGVIDVLEDHRKRNHATRPPDLANSANNANNASQEGQQDSEEDEEEEEEAPKSRARRHSKISLDAEPRPTTMKYYPPGWQVVLEKAKNNMRKHVCLFNAFPRRDRDLKEATLVLNDTIKEHLNVEGNSLEPGMFNGLSLTVSY
jgi:hypothetical protein